MEAAGRISWARAAVAHLRRADPALARVIDAVGPFQLRLRRERFQALCRAIIFQQLAGAAARTIYDRFVALFPGRSFPSPRQVLDAPEAALRGAGLSRQKSRYLKDLAAHIESRALNFHRFSRMTDEEIIAELIRVHGIGRWTAEMFLMFNLGRPDVFPVDDLGVRNAVRRLYRMRKMPDAKRLRALAERWRPYRSVASWYLWRSADIILPDGGTPSRRIPGRRRDKSAGKKKGQPAV
jgi:DNA-3-methyladenine glycosylase II